jgi:hypothetical protein
MKVGRGAEAVVTLTDSPSLPMQVSKYTSPTTGFLRQRRPIGLTTNLSS